MKSLTIPLAKRSYKLFIGDSKSEIDFSSYEALSPFLQNRCCFVITDENVAELYLNAVSDRLTKAQVQRLDTAIFPAGESSKNLETVHHLYSEAVKAGVDRNSVVIALGGGVVGDTAGFMAATFMRGIDLVQIPTSLVAQVDSSIGGKTGVDLLEGKNLVGVFHQPKAVLIDVATLDTLPDRQLRCGLAEVVKYGVILDADFFSYLEANGKGLLRFDNRIYNRIVLRCCELKAQVVKSDEFDTGLRAILNYGHTFGHALEKLTHYSGLTHGEAIAAGMGMAADLARLLDENPEKVELIERQDELFNAIGLPTRISGYSADQVFEAMQTDKKFVGGKKRFILPEKLGMARLVSDVPDNRVMEAIGGRCDPSR